MPICAHATTFLNGQCPGARGQKENLKLCYNFELVCFFNSQNRFDGKNYLLYFREKNQTQKISDQILEENWGIFSQAQKPLDFNSKVQKVDKVVIDKCPFNAHCPMGNAHATKFLNGHCPTLPMPPFFLMGIARVCPCPKILPIKQH